VGFFSGISKTVKKAAKQTVKATKKVATTKNLTYVAPYTAVLTKAGRKELAKTYGPIVSGYVSGASGGVVNSNITTALVNKAGGVKVPKPVNDAQFTSGRSLTDQLFSNFYDPAPVGSVEAAYQEQGEEGLPAWAPVAIGAAALVAVYFVVKK
jgi:hypothetical protein